MATLAISPSPTTFLLNPKPTTTTTTTTTLCSSPLHRPLICFRTTTLARNSTNASFSAAAAARTPLVSAHQIEEEAAGDFIRRLQNGPDVRGVALEGEKGRAVELTPQVAEAIAECFGEWLAERKGGRSGSTTLVRVSVGRDPRVSGRSLSAALFAGLRKGNCEVFDMGLATTPACFMSTILSPFGYHASVMVSGKFPTLCPNVSLHILRVTYATTALLRIFSSSARSDLHAEPLPLFVDWKHIEGPPSTLNPSLYSSIGSTSKLPISFQSPGTNCCTKEKSSRVASCAA